MIKMLHGVFGLPVNGIVKAMDKNSGPFEASKEQEERLINLGLAVRVADEDTPADDGDGEPIGFDETPPEYSVNMKADELREIGKLYGLTFKVGMRKDEMVAALDAYFADDETEADADELDETDNGDAPTFDAAEAVQ